MSRGSLCKGWGRCPSKVGRLDRSFSGGCGLAGRGRAGRGGSGEFQELVQICKDIGHCAVVGGVRTAAFSCAPSLEEGGREGWIARAASEGPHGPYWAIRTIPKGREEPSGDVRPRKERSAFVWIDYLRGTPEAVGGGTAGDTCQVCDASVVRKSRGAGRSWWVGGERYDLVSAGRLWSWPESPSQVTRPQKQKKSKCKKKSSQEKGKGK